MNGNSFVFSSGNITGTFISPLVTTYMNIAVDQAGFSGTINADLLPYTGDTLNIGNSGNRWDTIYADNLNISNAPYANITGGTTTGRLNVVTGIQTNQISSLSGNNVSINTSFAVSNTGISFTGNIVPSGSGLSNLGSPSNQLNNIYAGDVVSPGLDARYLRSSGDTIAGNIKIVPTSTLYTDYINSYANGHDLTISGQDILIDAASNIFLQTNSNDILQIGLNSVYASKDIIPTNPFVNLGSVTQPFETLYVQSINVTGIVLVESGTNIGSGVGVFAGATGNLLEFKSIQASGSISVTSSADTIFFSAAGGGGGIIGPIVSTDTAIAIWSGTNGIAIKNTSVTINSSGSITLPSGASLLVAASGVDSIGTANLPLNTIYTNDIVTQARHFAFCISTGTQTVAVADTFQDVTFETNAQIQGWTHTPGGYMFTGNSTGYYTISYVVMTAKNGGANSTLQTRALVGGLVVTGSQVSYINNVNNLPTSLSTSLISPVLSGQVFQIQMTADTTNSSILQAGSSPAIAVRIVRTI